MRNILLTVILISFVAPAFATPVDKLSDLEAAIIEQDYKKANTLAKELHSSRLSGDKGETVRYYLGLSYLRLGEYARAEETFKKLLSDRPRKDLYEKAAIGHIDVLYTQGFYENALKEANSFLSRYGGADLLSLAYLKAARANLKLARWTKAQELLKKIVEQFPDSFESNIAKQLLEEKEYFTVQVGSFAEKYRAEKLVEGLMQRSEYAYIVETKSSGKAVYRVRVGQLSTLNDAKELETKLSGLGYPTLIYP